MKLKISQSELEVMDVLWREAPLGSAEVVSRFCLLYTSPSPRDQRGSRMPSSA